LISGAPPKEMFGKSLEKVWIAGDYPLKTLGIFSSRLAGSFVLQGFSKSAIAAAYSPPRSRRSFSQ
jgi:hypothetical protein